MMNAGLHDLSVREPGQHWAVAMRACTRAEVESAATRIRKMGCEVAIAPTIATPAEIREDLARTAAPFAVKKGFRQMNAREIAACVLSGWISAGTVRKLASANDQPAIDALDFVVSAGEPHASY